jgi:hypothetical protein
MTWCQDAVEVPMRGIGGAVRGHGILSDRHRRTLFLVLHRRRSPPNSGPASERDSSFRTWHTSVFHSTATVMVTRHIMSRDGERSAERTCMYAGWQRWKMEFGRVSEVVEAAAGRHDCCLDLATIVLSRGHRGFGVLEAVPDWQALHPSLQHRLG